MNIEEVIDMTINNAKAAIRLGEELMAQYGKEDPRWDVAYQVVKDNNKFIQEQKHTLSLMDDRSI